MEQERAADEVIRITCGKEHGEIAMSQVEKILSGPRIIPVPGAPAGVMGVLYEKGRLLPVMGTAAGSVTAPACVVIVKRDDGSVFGMAADEVAGGGSFDTFYGRRV